MPRTNGPKEQTAQKMVCPGTTRQAEAKAFRGGPTSYHQPKGPYQTIRLNVVLTEASKLGLRRIRTIHASPFASFSIRLTPFRCSSAGTLAVGVTDP